MLALQGVIAFVVAFVALRLLVGRFARVALDRPNERSLHEHPVPRTGGLAILAGIAAAMAIPGPRALLPFVLALVLAAVSLADDLRGVPTPVRFAAHVIAASVFAWYVLSPMNPVELLFVVFGIAWVTNLYNFMDGSDGLAGGMSVIGFGAYASAAVAGGDAALAALSIAVAAAAAAFLTHNFHPARIFLGDVGSIPLGFLAGALGILGWRNDLWPLWFPVLVFAPFIGDATLTLLKRLVRRERVWQAHREHYYQRMVRMGLGHRGTALVSYAVMLFCALAALLGRTQAPPLQALAFFGTAAVLAVLAIVVDWRWIRYTARA